MPWIILLFVLIVVLVGGTIGIIVVMKKRKKAENTSRNQLIRSEQGKVVGVAAGYSEGGGLLYGENAEMQTVISFQAVRQPVRAGRMDIPKQAVWLQLTDMESGQTYQIMVDAPIIVGRGYGDDAAHSIILTYSDVSSNHCKFYLMGGYLYVQDLNSTNHTYLNQQLLVSSMPVKTGDYISFAKHVFYISISE